MKQIRLALHGAVDIALSASYARQHLHAATVAVECTSPARAKKELALARASLVNLRRTQTAALANIDEALKTL